MRTRAELVHATIWLDKHWLITVRQLAKVAAAVRRWQLPALRLEGVASVCASTVLVLDAAAGPHRPAAAGVRANVVAGELRGRTFARRHPSGVEVTQGTTRGKTRGTTRRVAVSAVSHISHISHKSAQGVADFAKCRVPVFHKSYKHYRSTLGDQSEVTSQGTRLSHTGGTTR